MSNGLYLSLNIDQLGKILMEYFSPQELFEIFHLDLLDEGEDNDNS